MTAPTNAQQFIGLTAVGSDGGKVGKIGQVYLDDATGEPVWVTIATGMFGTRESFAPLQGARAEGDSLMLAVTKDLIKDAPSVEDDQHITSSEQDALYQHYSGHLGTGQAGYAETGQDGYPSDDAGYQADTGYRPGEPGFEGETGSQAGYGEEDLAGQPAAPGRDVPGPAAGDAMTRSEERLRVGTEQVEAGRARLRKYVVTENVTTTVPVSHEEVRVEREPVTDASRDAALSGEPISEEEHEVTLRAERPVVEKEAVPVERVRLATETVTENQEVSETVRKEQIDDPEVDPGSTRDA